MTAVILREAEDDLEHAFNYYESKRRGLGVEMVDEFRRAIERILEYPHAWHRLDETYRRCQFHRFPFGIIYRVDKSIDCIVVVAVMHLSRRPNWWQERT